MGAMKDYAIWLEENGYTVWNDIAGDYDGGSTCFTSKAVNIGETKLWDMYLTKKKKTRKQYRDKSTE